MGGFDGPIGPRRAPRLRRAWRWFARTFGATAEVDEESEDDIVPLRVAEPALVVQVFAAKLHANDIPVWVSAASWSRTDPILPWPAAALPRMSQEATTTSRSSLHVQRRDLERAEALLSEPSPFDEDGELRPQVP